MAEQNEREVVGVEANAGDRREIRFSGLIIIPHYTNFWPGPSASSMDLHSCPEEIMKGYMYILLCIDRTYYTGSTIHLTIRYRQHQSGVGALYTQVRRPLKLVYFEIYPHIAQAFRREKQVQGWSRKKKEALIAGRRSHLPRFARGYTRKEVGFREVGSA